MTPTPVDERILPTRDLPKAPTGIHGLDELTLGGLPRGRPSTPLKKIIGDLSNEEKVLVGLDLRRKEPAHNLP